MPQIAEPITSLEQELESRIEWLEKGLKLIIKIANDDESGLVMTAKAILDGEPTTADEYNISEGRRGHGYDYGEFEDENDFDVSPDAPAVLLGTLIPENTVRISDINEEIAKEWNRDREERINKEKTK